MRTNETYTALNDKALESVLARAKAGDQNALTQVVAQFYPKIFRYVYYRLDNHEDAKDLTNDIFIKVMQGIKDQKGFFRAWIYRIASNTITDFYRYKSVRSIVNNDLQLPEYAIVEESMSADSFRGEELKRAIKKLTEEQQQVILLRFVEGYSSQEIASIMEKSSEAVRGIQFRALNMLRKILGEGN